MLQGPLGGILHGVLESRIARIAKKGEIGYTNWVWGRCGSNRRRGAADIYVLNGYWVHSEIGP